MTDLSIDRPGIRTTEFWLALVAVVLNAAAAVYSDSDLARLGGIIGASLVAAGYVLTRAKVKTAKQGITVGSVTRWAGSPPTGTYGGATQRLDGDTDNDPSGVAT